MGDFHISSIKPVDMAFGGVINDSLEALSVDSLSESIKSFIKRPSNKRIFRGRYSSPIGFLSALRRYQLNKTIGSSESSGIIRSFNLAKLPMIFYYRELNYEEADLDGHNHHYINQADFDGLTGFVSAYISWLRLNYRIVFVGYDSESIDILVNAWAFHLARKSKKNHIFTCNYEFDGEIIPIKNYIEDPKTLIATGIQGEHEDGRIYASELTKSVISPVFYGKSAPKPLAPRWEFMQPEIIHSEK